VAALLRGKISSGDMISPPQFRINVKSLLPKRRKVEPRRVLREAQKEILRQLRREIQDTAFSTRAKRALSQGMTTRIGNRSLKVIAKHPAFFPLLRGQKSEQMTWLTKAKRPIPIILDDGTLIFRNATPRSMQNGSWIHPGRSPTTVIERARKKTREIIQRRVVESLRKGLGV
jgi:hypothetical protein